LYADNDQGKRYTWIFQGLILMKKYALKALLLMLVASGMSSAWHDAQASHLEVPQ
jgi:hypothetical protein